MVASDDDRSLTLQMWDLRNSVSPLKEFVGHTKVGVGARRGGRGAAVLRQADASVGSLQQRVALTRVIGARRTQCCLLWGRRGGGLVAAGMPSLQLGVGGEGTQCDADFCPPTPCTPGVLSIAWSPDDPECGQDTQIIAVLVAR